MTWQRASQPFGQNVNSAHAAIRTIVILFSAIWLSLFSGCRSEQLGQDQHDMRSAMLRLYDDQLMDNLIRAKLRLPILQVDYSNATGTLEQDETANVQDTYTKVINNFASIPTVTQLAAPAVRGTNTNAWQSGLTGTQKGTLTVTGQPLNNVDLVYELYKIAANDKDFLRDVDVAHIPNKSLVHEGRFFPVNDGSPFGLRYFYIPNTPYANDMFFLLYLKTTVERQTIPSILPYYATTITMVNPVPLPPGATAGQFKVYFKDQIPNDSGQMIVPINGLATERSYQPDPAVKPGTLTNSVLLNVSQAEYNDSNFIKNLAGASVQLTNANVPPTYTPPPQNPFEALRSQLELLRLQNFGK